jgi:glycine C-acetyltransferase/8-amino-7-oxononanoate synthase
MRIDGQKLVANMTQFWRFANNLNRFRNGAFSRVQLIRGGHTIFRMTEPEPLRFTGKNEVRWRGRTLVYYSGCDYFRLARDSRIAAAMRAGLAKHGLNVAASRLTTGNHEVYHELETGLARFFGAEVALLFPDGYLAPLAVAKALADEFTHILMDEFAHGALRDAAMMTGHPVKYFKHRDTADLAKRFKQCGKKSRPLVFTDGMFAHDGSVAPLRDYLKVLPAGGMILVDDAHGGGVLGKTGRGTLELAGVSRQRIIQTVALSKAFGVYGGAVLTSPALRKKIVERTHIFIGTTPLPPPLAAAALASLKVLHHEPARRVRLFLNVKKLRTSLRAAGWEMADTPGPIVRLEVRSGARALALKKRLLAAGIYPPFLKYGISDGVFRFVIASEHTAAQLNGLAKVLGDFKK